MDPRQDPWQAAKRTDHLALSMTRLVVPRPRHRLYPGQVRLLEVEQLMEVPLDRLGFHIMHHEL